MTEQLTVFDIIFNHTGHSKLTPAEEYYIETGKRTYWQDSQGKPYKWWQEDSNTTRQKVRNE